MTNHSRGATSSRSSRDPQVDVVGQSGGGADALEDIQHLRPDPVFLDVEMPKCDGFDVLEMLGSAAQPIIVFVTAYDKYATTVAHAG